MAFKLVSVTAEIEQNQDVSVEDEEGSLALGQAVGATLFEPILRDLRKNVLGD